MTAQQQNTATDKASKKLDDRETNLNNRQKKLDKRKSDLDKREAELNRQKEELDKRSQEPEKPDSKWEQLFQDIDTKISTLGSRLGKIIEHVIGDRGDVVNKFLLQGFEITQSSRNVVFDNKNLGVRGEIDILLKGNTACILIEIKTTLEKGDITKHVARLNKYRRYADARNDTRTLYGAVAGAQQEKEIVDYAHSNGLFVIHQFGETDEKLVIPKDFKPKKW